MRNLDQYPITLDEEIAAVEKAAKQYEARLRLKVKRGQIPLGDIQGIALQSAIRRLKRLQFAASEQF